jgi:hypothetical protein
MLWRAWKGLVPQLGADSFSQLVQHRFPSRYCLFKSLVHHLPERSSRLMRMIWCSMVRRTGVRRRLLGALLLGWRSLVGRDIRPWQRHGRVLRHRHFVIYSQDCEVSLNPAKARLNARGWRQRVDISAASYTTLGSITLSLGLAKTSIISLDQGVLCNRP